MKDILLTPKIKAMDRRIAAMVLSYQGGHGYEDRLFVPSTQNIEQVLAEVETTLAEIRQPEFDGFWQNHFDAILRGYRYTVLEHTHLPHNYVYPMASFLERMMRADQEDAEWQMETMAIKLGNLPDVLTAVINSLHNLSDLRRKQVTTCCQTVLNIVAQAGDFFVTKRECVSVGSYDTFYRALGTADASLREAIAAISLLPPAREVIKPIPFDVTMRDGMQVCMESVLSWYADDYKQRFDEFTQAGARIDPRRSPFDIILQDARGYGSHHEQVSDAKEIVQAIRKAALNYISLPAGEVCEMGAVPEQSKLTCPTAVYIGGNVWKKELWGMMGFNEDNYTALNRAELWGHITHECYPGHHTNYVKTAAGSLPHTFMMRLPLTRTILEGIAHRSETLMMPYYEDDVARLASHRRVLYCAARVKVEVDLNYYRRPAEEIMKLYLDEMRINEMSARLQTQAHLMNPGDAVSYYTGAKILEDKRRDLGMDSEQFTELIFSFGFIPVSTMLSILELNSVAWEGLKRFHA